MKYRQTLIWEFLNKKVLRPIDKFKVICRLETFFLITHVNNFLEKYKRVNKLYFKFQEEMTNVQIIYFGSLIKRLCEKQISFNYYRKSLENFFNFYKA